MIRDVVLHLSGDQPMLCDIETLPKPGDVALVCTNLRMIDGKRPVFIDRTDSWFTFPMSVIRFVEIHQTSLAAAATGLPALPGAADGTGQQADEALLDEDLEPDEDLLRRVREA